MKVVALVAWSNGSYSMDEKTVAEIPDGLASELIAKGIVAESPDYYGSESGLPAITEADAGKVLTASTVTGKGAVIVPRQYVQITETQKEFDNADASLFTDGAKIIVTVGESTYEAVIDEGRVEILSHIPVITIRKSGDALLYYLDDGNAPENAYISVNLAHESGVWVASDIYDIVSLADINSRFISDKSNKEILDEIDRGVNVVLRYYNAFANVVAFMPINRYMTSGDGFDGLIAEPPSLLFNGIHITFVLGTTNVESYEWTKIEDDNRFIVTLTPTALDYSGTMDKTILEIDAAYRLGKTVVFRLDGSGASLPIFDCAVNVVENGGDAYPSYQSQVVIAMANLMLAIYTPSTNTGTDATYGAHAYNLTPAT